MMKKTKLLFTLIIGIMVCTSGLAFINRHGVPEVQAAVIQNVAYLPEHFIWNTTTINVGAVAQFPPNTVTTGIAPSHRDLPNLHLNFPATNNAGEPTRGIGWGTPALDITFRNRPNVVQITIPQSIERTDGETFINNTSLSVITVLPGSNLQSNLTAFMFRGSPIETINWDGNDNQQVINNTIMMGAQVEMGTRSGYIPPGTTAIRNNAFDGRGISGELILPASVQSLGQDAFLNNNISTLTIMPGSNLGSTNNAFANNPLSTINFDGNAGLRLDTAGNLVQNWSNAILVGTTAGRIPHGTMRIGWGAFAGRGLSGTITIPNTVHTLELDVFAFNSFDTLFFRGDIPAFNIHGMSAFRNTTVRSIRFGRGTMNVVDFLRLHNTQLTILESVIIPASVASMPAPTQMATVMGMTGTVTDFLGMGGTEVVIDGYPYISLWGSYGRIVEVGIFGDNPNLVIYTAHPSRPIGWHENFNIGTSGTVIWNYNMWNDITINTTGQGTITATGDYGDYLTEVTIGDNRTLTASPAPGWRLVRWDITGASAQNNGETA